MLVRVEIGRGGWRIDFLREVGFTNVHLSILSLFTLIIGEEPQKSLREEL